MADESESGDRVAEVMATLTPQELLVVHGAGICMIAKEVLVSLREGKQHPAGVYAPKGNVLTIDGQPTSYELVAVMIPLEMLQPFAIAHSMTRNSPEGEALAARLTSGLPVGPAGNC